MKAPTSDDIIAASERIRPWIHRTPVFRCATFDALVGATLFFKCENFQKTGAFKARGAHNAVFALNDEQAARGVATHSSGNHGAALSCAAASRGIAATIVVPENAAAAKVAAIRHYGGEVIACAPNTPAREATLSDVTASSGAHFIHPFNNAQVIAGQGTCALELLNEIDHLDVLIAPVGGGGLLSGTAITAHAYNPTIKIVAAEPERADDAKRSLQAGEIIDIFAPDTIADGLKTSLGSMTFPLIREHVEQIYTVSEEQIIAAMKLIWERMKIVVEPSSATVLAVLLAYPQEFSGQRVGAIFSGGNVNLDSLPWRT